MIYVPPAERMLVQLCSMTDAMKGLGSLSSPNEVRPVYHEIGLDLAIQVRVGDVDRRLGDCAHRLRQNGDLASLQNVVSTFSCVKGSFPDRLKYKLLDDLNPDLNGFNRSGNPDAYRWLLLTGQYRDYVGLPQASYKSNETDKQNYVLRFKRGVQAGVLERLGWNDRMIGNVFNAGGESFASLLIQLSKRGWPAFASAALVFHLFDGEYSDLVRVMKTMEGILQAGGMDEQSYWEQLLLLAQYSRGTSLSQAFWPHAFDFLKIMEDVFFEVKDASPTDTGAHYRGPVRKEFKPIDKKEAAFWWAKMIGTPEEVCRAIAWIKRAEVNQRRSLKITDSSTRLHVPSVLHAIDALRDLGILDYKVEPIILDILQIIYADPEHRVVRRYDLLFDDLPALFQRVASLNLSLDEEIRLLSAWSQGERLVLRGAARDRIITFAEKILAVGFSQEEAVNLIIEIGIKRDMPEVDMTALGGRDLNVIRAHLEDVQRKYDEKVGSFDPSEYF